MMSWFDPKTHFFFSYYQVCFALFFTFIKRQIFFLGLLLWSCNFQVLLSCGCDGSRCLSTVRLPRDEPAPSGKPSGSFLRHWKALCCAHPLLCRVGVWPGHYSCHHSLGWNYWSLLSCVARDACCLRPSVSVAVTVKPLGLLLLGWFSFSVLHQ